VSVETEEQLMAKIMVLNEHLWEGRVHRSKVEEWLANFTGRVAAPEVERVHALYWLSQFMYFGSKEIRVLIRALYRDLFLRPLVQDARRSLKSGATLGDLKRKVAEELAATRFFGLGNPSESGVHLLYYFRQENQLQKQHFMDAVRIFGRDDAGVRQLRKPELKRYVFLDDICGSGDTALDYSEEVIGELHSHNPSAIASYYCLFATRGGMDRVRTESRFGRNCGAVFELESSYKCLTPGNRHFAGHLFPDIDETTACQLARAYGDLLDPRYASGWKDSQMLLGFHHNTPDNTIGIMWSDSEWNGSLIKWAPLFKRYPKVA
jgi:hypothetical protein